MKKIIVFWAIFQIALVSVNAQSSTEKINELKKINNLVVEKYKAGDLKVATEAAHKAVDLSLEIFGSESSETAISYFNLGEIYNSRKKYDDAALYLKKSLEIYQLKPEQNEKKIAQLLERLGVVLTYDGKTEEAAKIIENLILAAENAFGSESKNIIPYLKTAGDFYIYTKNYNKAENLFVRRYNTTFNTFGEKSDELEKISDEFDCYSSQFGEEVKNSKRDKFYALIRGSEKTKEISTDADDKTINGGVINGKALSLPPPSYPSGAKQRGSRGAILVKVLIDEKGEVVSARAFCGQDEELRNASENAAMKAKFRPTTLEGKPVKVSGVITYIFN